jgi:hypothetical protein
VRSRGHKKALLASFKHLYYFDQKEERKTQNVKKLFTSCFALQSLAASFKKKTTPPQD